MSLQITNYHRLHTHNTEIGYITVGVPDYFGWELSGGSLVQKMQADIGVIVWKEANQQRNNVLKHRTPRSLFLRCFFEDF